MPEAVIHSETFPEGYRLPGTNGSDTSTYGRFGDPEKVLLFAVKNK